MSISITLRGRSKSPHTDQPRHKSKQGQRKDKGSAIVFHARVNSGGQQKGSGRVSCIERRQSAVCEAQNIRTSTVTDVAEYMKLGLIPSAYPYRSDSGKGATRTGCSRLPPTNLKSILGSRNQPFTANIQGRYLLLFETIGRGHGLVASNGLPPLGCPTPLACWLGAINLNHRRA